MKNTLSKDDFWNDCYDVKLAESLKNDNYGQYYGRNINNKKKFKNNKNVYINLSYEKKNNRKKKNDSKNKSNNNKTIENNNFSKIYKNHQILEENLENNNKIDKDLELKKKNAMMRCHGLYAYGVEVKKAKLLNDENNKKEKIKDEMSKCTFKPKISKYSQKRQNLSPNRNYNKNNYQKNIKNNIKQNSEYKKNNLNEKLIENGVTKNNRNKNINNYDEEDSNSLEECTFKPKISKKNIQKVFDKTKSLANEKDNAEFILRYTKAREDYMIKKLKKISTKDDSYDATLLTLANKLNNKQYKNGSNELTDSKNPNNNVYLREHNNEYLENKKKMNISNNIINNLRNNLLDINLNEEE